MQIIPAIDIIEGKCVRLTGGDYAQMKVYNEDPLEVAKEFEANGITRLHLVDLDGAKAGAVQNWKVLEKIAGNTKLVIDFGGGIKKREDVEICFQSGAALATIGSIAVKHPAVFGAWIEEYGATKFLLGADVKDRKIAIGGWLQQTEIDIVDFMDDYFKKGITQIFCTDISRDGKLEGPATALYATIIKQFPDIFFIASGGVSSMEDLLSLKQVGCKAAIVGKAIYEGRITLDQLTRIS